MATCSYCGAYISRDSLKQGECEFCDVALMDPEVETAPKQQGLTPIARPWWPMNALPKPVSPAALEAMGVDPWHARSQGLSPAALTDDERRALRKQRVIKLVFVLIFVAFLVGLVMMILWDSFSGIG